MKRKYFGLGINNFKYFPSATLTGCLKDVQHTSEYFKERGVDELIIIPQELADENYVKDQLIAFRGTRWEEDTMYFIHMSTHGSHKPCLTEKDFFDEVIVMRDFDGNNGCIVDDFVNLYLQGVPDSSRVVFLADMCMSTGMTKALVLGWLDKYLQNPICPFIPLNQTRGLFANLFSDSFIDVDESYPQILIPGCEEHGTSADTTNGGALTCAFMDTLKSRAGHVTHRELITSIVQWLKMNRFSQKPTMQLAKEAWLDEYLMAW